MKILRRLFVVGLLFLFIVSFPIVILGSETTIDNFQLMTENYPPFNYESNGMLKGISIDLIEKMLKKMGSGKTRKDIRLMPWARAYQYTQLNEKTCLFSMVRTKQREPLFKWVGPIAPMRIVLIAKKSKEIKIRSIDDLSEYRVGAVRHDIGQQLLIKNGFEEERLKLVHSQKINLLKWNIAKNIL